MTDYKEAENYLLGFTDYEKLPSVVYSPENYDLRRMYTLLEKLGNPHLNPKTVHITGTKGKGSTAAMIASILSAAGYRTGLFTSPHLKSMRERIQINGQAITEQELVAGVKKLKPIVSSLMRSPEWVYGNITTFELLTALAFDYFAKKDVEYQVVEVGMGGRLDATNVVKTQVAVITSISLDHEGILGNTLEKIATEKSGIIKQKSTVILSPQKHSVENIIKRACRESQAKLICIGRDYICKQKSFNWEGQSFSVYNKKFCYDVFIPLLGDYQLENATAAIAAIEALPVSGAQITQENIVHGLAEVSWPGRLQVIGLQPWIVVDGAHNPYSMQMLRDALVKYFAFKRLFIIMGISVDKNIHGIVKELLPLAPTVIVTASKHPRAIQPLRLAEEFTKWDRSGEIAPNISTALTRARYLATPSDLILVTGSLFVVAEAIEALESEGKKRRHNTTVSR